MAAIVFEPIEALESAAQPEQQLPRAEIAEVIGRERGQQHHADVRRRGAVGGLFVGSRLVVVDGQPLVARAHECLEEEPRPSCQSTKHALVARAWSLGVVRRHQACPACDRGGEEPGDKNRRGDGQRRGADPGDDGARTDGEERRSEHPAPQARLPGGRARGVRRGRPLKQVLAREHHPRERAGHRVDDDGGLVPKKHKPQQRAFDVAPAPLSLHDRRQDRREEREQSSKRPVQRSARQPGPAAQQHEHQPRGIQAAAEVVGDLPTIDSAQSVVDVRLVRRRHAREEPRQKLPVTTRPPVHPPRVRRVVGGVVLEQHDIARESRPAMDPLEQIVAQDRVLRSPSLEAPCERIHVVDALADVDTRPEQVLVQVRGGVGVDVEAGVTGEDPVEPRAARTCRRSLHAGLHDRISRGNAPGAFVEDRSIERMRQNPDQPLCAPHRKLGVAVERDDEASAGQPIRRSLVAHVAALGVSAKQPVELLELPALALPAHEASFGRVPARLSVQQVERPGSVLAVLRVERGDRFCGTVDQVPRLGGRRGIHVIGQQREL